MTDNRCVKSAVKHDKKQGRRTDLSIKRHKQFVFDSIHTWENCENGGSKLLWCLRGLYVAVVNLAWIKPRKACPRVWEERLSEYAFAKIYRAEWSGSHNKFSRQVCLLAERRILENELEQIKKPSVQPKELFPSPYTGSLQVVNPINSPVLVSTTRSGPGQKSFSLSSLPRNAQSIAFLWLCVPDWAGKTKAGCYVDRFSLDKDLILLKKISNIKIPVDTSQDWEMPFFIERYRRGLPSVDSMWIVTHNSVFTVTCN